MPTYPVGSAHGRFQPLHNGHLEYLLAAKERCRFLWVGITQWDVRSLQQSQDAHRHEPAHNPMTFFERLEMISTVLMDAGISRNDFAVIPFPIEEPTKLRDFLPVNIPVFTTIYDDWNRHKVEVLTRLGYEVLVLWERVDKQIDGMRVRQWLRDGNDQWKRLVPRGTRSVIEKYQIADRVRMPKGS